MLKFLPQLIYRLLMGLLLILTITSTSSYAQRGLPPSKKIRSALITKYPQHLDFLPDMVKLLKVPAGWEVKVAASGLGRPRMMYTSPDGALYITRRDAGDVLMLMDDNRKPAGVPILQNSLRVNKALIIAKLKFEEILLHTARCSFFTIDSKKCFLRYQRRASTKK